MTPHPPQRARLPWRAPRLTRLPLGGATNGPDSFRADGGATYS